MYGMENQYKTEKIIELLFFPFLFRFTSCLIKLGNLRENLWEETCILREEMRYLSRLENVRIEGSKQDL